MVNVSGHHSRISSAWTNVKEERQTMDKDKLMDRGKLFYTFFASSFKLRTLFQILVKILFQSFKDV